MEENFEIAMLTEQEIRHLLQRGEGTRIEFKEAQNGVPATLYDTVSSFLNKEGGIILLGRIDTGGSPGFWKRRNNREHSSGL